MVSSRGPSITLAWCRRRGATRSFSTRVWAMLLSFHTNGFQRTIPTPSSSRCVCSTTSCNVFCVAKGRYLWISSQSPLCLVPKVSCTQSSKQDRCSSGMTIFRCRRMQAVAGSKRMPSTAYRPMQLSATFSSRSAQR